MLDAPNRHGTNVAAIAAAVAPDSKIIMLVRRRLRAPLPPRLRAPRARNLPVARPKTRAARPAGRLEYIAPDGRPAARPPHTTLPNHAHAGQF